jgi:hypothetical protein
MQTRLALLLLALSLAHGTAIAQVDPFEFEVHPCQTVGHGMIEVESLHNTVVGTLF